MNTTAAKGATGTLLLDPTDITISTAASSSIGVAGGTYSGTASSSTLNAGDLTAALGSSNVVVDTSSGFASPGNITVNTPVVWGNGNSLTLKADNNIAVNALIQNTSSGSINLNGDSAVSYSALRTNSGAINIAGNPGGSSRAGSVAGTSITSTTGSVNVRSQGSVTTGSINAGTGTISVDGNASVAITGALATSNSSSAAIVINAGSNHSAGDGSGGDISLSGGSVLVGFGGRGTLYTGSVAGSTGVTATVGAGSGRFRYNSAVGIDNFSAPLGSGVYAVYRESPTLTVTGNSPSIIYGAAAPGFSVAYSGLANGDTSLQALSTGATVSASTTNSSSNHVKAGTYAVTPSGAVDRLGYSVSLVPGSFVVAQKALTSTGSTAAGKTYDGTTTATVNTSATTFAFGAANGGDGKAYNADIVSVNHAALASGAFSDKNAGSNKTVTVSGITLQGADAGNYSVTGTALASITPRALTASASAPDKVYDGTTTAAPALTLSGLVGPETLGVSGTGTFNSKDVLSANTVTVNSTALTNGGFGGFASNYTLGTGQTAVAHITPKALAATATAPNKTYDGTVNSTAVMSINAAGFIGTETVSATGSGTFNSKDVLAANLVTVNSVVLANGNNGGLASNYSLGSGQNAAASITPKALTASLTGADKTYDGTTAASATLGISAGLVGAEMVSATGNAAFNSKDVASANQVTVNSVALADGANGGIASNYSLAVGQTVTAHITPKSLTATATAPDKTYDGSIGATTSLNIASGLVGSETVAASGSGTFNSKDVLSANQVTVNSVALGDGANGGLASNYSLAAGQTAAASITPKSVSVSGLSVAASKVYDATTNATVLGSAALASESVGSGTASDGKVYAGDGIALAGTATGAYNSKNVASANSVIIGGLSLSGPDLANYTLTVAPFSAVITAKLLSMSGLSVPANKTNDGTTNATVSGTAVLAAPEAVGTGSGVDGKYYIGDTVAISGTATGTYNSADVNLANTVTFGGLSLTGDSASNYSLNTVLRLPPKLRFPR